MPRCPRARFRGRWLVVLALGLGSLVGCGGTEPPLPDLGRASIDGRADDAEPLSWLRRFAIDRVLDYRVFSGARAGFVALVARGGRVVYARTSGFADREARVPMSLETRFHLASMTKPITAVAALMLIEDGKLALDDPVSRYVPAFADAAVASPRDANGHYTTRPLETPLTVRHLLTFTSGIGGYAESDDPLDRIWRSPDVEAAGLGSLADRIALVARRPLYEAPGTRWRYGLSADVLARVVEVAAAEPFDAFLRRRLFDPLGMTSTGFPDQQPPDAPWARIYTHAEDGSLVRERRFDAYYGRGWTPGGGGLVSTATDTLRFALMLWNGGEWNGVRILAPERVAAMTRLQVPDGVLSDMGLEGLGWGFGVCVVADERVTPMRAKDGDFWWSGLFGTHFWVSPSTDTVVVVMQQTEPGPRSGPPIAGPLVQALALP
ncbi:MAG: serine hydrolase domain-containing protein [Myxococcota bacterium]